MIVMSLDASTTCIGWSIFDDDNLIDCGKLKPTVDKLEWRDRIQNFIPQLHNLMKQYYPQKVYVENVPLINKQMITLVQLGATQGMILGLCCSHNVNVEFIDVGTWRKNIGLYDGTKEGKERDVLKAHSIQKANELFGLDLKCIYTKSGNYNSDKSDDDISDSILIYASTRPKYQIK
jgi:Holliday junction resolvasome RuvABC endonuclease subunit